MGHALELRRRAGDDLRSELLGMGVLIDTVTKTWLGQGSVAWVERKRNPGLWRPLMDATLRASLRLSKITFDDFVTPFNPGYILRWQPHHQIKSSGT